jgi:aspartyl-tRNA(Asn)/glutamyl-tRNA(Gln) amidotransferase subunit A
MVVALRAGQTTSVELVERALAREEAWRQATNAFSQVWAEEALAQAGLVDDAIAAGREVPLLAGIPLVVKDLYDVAGHETTGCCAAYAGRMAERDAPTIERVRAAGLVMVGKANQHELAAGGTNLVSACGRTGNPWDPARMTGGSSGGSGAAVAAGVVPWALGSDTGGSIRIPASMCGTFGLKPTTGSITIQGLLPLGPSLDCPGPMAATAVDLWLLHCVLSGRETVVPSPGWIRPEGNDGRSFRVAVLKGFHAEFLHTDTAAAVERTAGSLVEAGVEVQEVLGRGIEGSRQVWARVCCPEFVEAHPALRDPERRARVDPSVVAWFEAGERFTADERAEAAQRRLEIGRWYRERLEGFDALVIPTTPYPAPVAGQDIVDLGPNGSVRVDDVGPGFMTSTVNLAGLPAVNVPAALSADGLPIGVTLVGADGAEETLCRLAALWESATA